MALVESKVGQHLVVATQERIDVEFGASGVRIAEDEPSALRGRQLRQAQTRVVDFSEVLLVEDAGQGRP